MESFTNSRIKDRTIIKEIEEMIELDHFQLVRQRSSLAALRFCLKLELVADGEADDRDLLPPHVIKSS